MFRYQCRYCRVSFGKWGKLVSHKREEHREEFEALRKALLLSERGSAIAKFLQLEGGNENTTTLIMHSHPPSALSSSPPPIVIKKEEAIKDDLKLPARQITTSTTPKLSQKLDAKDLENQGVSLRIPASNLYTSRPSLYPSIPSSSFYQNGNGVVDYKRSQYYRGPEMSTSNNRLSSSSSTSQALTDKNWTAPFPLPSTSPVLYHQMNDDDEMEICVSPSAGFRISITTHPVSRKILVGASPSSSSSKSHHHTNETNCFQKKETLQHKHVVIDELRDELQMNNCVAKKHSHFNGEIRHPAPASAHTAFAMLKNRGKRLKRLHSQLQLQPPFSLSNGDCRDDDNDNITQRRMKKLINGGGISRRRNSIDSVNSPVRFVDANSDPRASPTRPN